MKIQTKPREAGEPIEAIQFLGDPSVHPNIFLDQDFTQRPGRYHCCIRCYDETRGSRYLENGTWIVMENNDIRLISPTEFDRDWQLVTTTAPKE